MERTKAKFSGTLLSLPFLYIALAHSRFIVCLFSILSGCGAQRLRQKWPLSCNQLGGLTKCSQILWQWRAALDPYQRTPFVRLPSLCAMSTGKTLCPPLHPGSKATLIKRKGALNRRKSMETRAVTVQVYVIGQTDQLTDYRNNEWGPKQPCFVLEHWNENEVHTTGNTSIYTFGNITLPKLFRKKET